MTAADMTAADMPAATLLDRIDPRARLTAALIFCLSISFADQPATLTAAAMLAGAAAMAARLPLATLLRRLAALEGCLFLGVAALPFSMPGETAFQVLGCAASWAGLERAAVLLIRAAAAAAMVAAMIGALEPATLGRALAQLGAPDKLICLFLFAQRYLHVLGREYRRLTTALRARGFRPGCNRHTWRTYGLLFGMLSLRSLERADRVLAAMRCRGFDGRFHAPYVSPSTRRVRA